MPRLIEGNSQEDSLEGEEQLLRHSVSFVTSQFARTQGTSARSQTFAQMAESLRLVLTAGRGAHIIASELVGAGSGGARV